MRRFGMVVALMGLLLLLAGSVECSGEQAAPPPPGGPWRLAWAEEFDGPALNTSRWTIMDNGTHGDLEQQLCLLHQLSEPLTSCVLESCTVFGC